MTFSSTITTRLYFLFRHHDAVISERWPTRCWAVGRMLMEAANRPNDQMKLLVFENAPAKQISAHHGHTGSFADRARL